MIIPQLKEKQQAFCPLIGHNTSDIYPFRACKSVGCSIAPQARYTGLRIIKRIFGESDVQKNVSSRYSVSAKPGV